MTRTAYQIAGCPACEGTRATTLRDAADIRAEIEALWQFHTSRLRAGVPISRLFDRAWFTQPPPLQLVECCTCGVLYRNPRERDDRLVRRYADEETDPATMLSLHAALRKTAVAQVQKLTIIAGQPGTGLEVGSYAGAFLAAAARSGWDFRGVDPNEPINRFVRSLGHAVQHGSIKDIEGDSIFDAVVFWNCFDQLPDPRGALRDARRLLRPGGVLAIRVPNGAFYAGIIRGRLPRPLKHAILAWNNLLAFPYRYGFTPASLGSLLDRHGFAVAAVRHDTLADIADPWTRTWARAEAHILKALTRPAAPWLEVYARRTG